MEHQPRFIPGILVDQIGEGLVAEHLLDRLQCDVVIGDRSAIQFLGFFGQVFAPLIIRQVIDLQPIAVGVLGIAQCTGQTIMALELNALDRPQHVQQAFGETGAHNDGGLKAVEHPGLQQTEYVERVFTAFGVAIQRSVQILAHGEGLEVGAEQALGDVLEQPVDVVARLVPRIAFQETPVAGNDPHIIGGKILPLDGVAQESMVHRQMLIEEAVGAWNLIDDKVPILRYRPVGDAEQCRMGDEHDLATFGGVFHVLQNSLKNVTRLAHVAVEPVHRYLVGLKAVRVISGLGMPLGNALLAGLGDNHLLTQPCHVDGVPDGGIRLARPRWGRDVVI